MELTHYSSGHGLATHYVPSRRIPSLLESLASLEDPSLEIINSTIEEFYYEPDADESTIPLRGPVRVALDSAFCHQSVEDIMTALEAHTLSMDAAVSSWATETLKVLNLRSPTSLRIALHAFRRSKNSKLRDVLRTELGIATALCVRHRYSISLDALLILFLTIEWCEPRLCDGG